MANHAQIPNHSPLMNAIHPLLVGVLMLLASRPISAASYEVAQRHPQASDDGPGTRERPWKTLAKAVSSLGPGDTVLIRGGVYRERIVIKAGGTADAPVRFEAGPGEDVVLTGADRLTGWQKAEPDRPIYPVPWSHRFNTYTPTMTHPNDERHRLIGRCEQVLVDGYLLRQVLSSAQLAPGAFFADVTNELLYVWDSGNGDLRKANVEAAVRQEILRVEGQHVQVRGLRFRYAANAAQHGAVVLAGAHGVLEDCRLEEMNSSGATLVAEHLTVRRCTFRNNGQIGFGANRAHHLLFTDCLVERNNLKNFDRGWEAGGDKLVLSREAVLERSRFVNNHGNGIWFDIGNENCTVRQCLIADNDDAGIFYEISFGLHAHDNVIIANGFAPTAGAWGAQAAVSLSSSPDCVVERNLIFGNREGFNFREQTRSTPTIDNRASQPVWNHDEVIRDNIMGDNRDAQVWGWFDTNDQRHWPARMQQGPADSPRELNLEKLRLRFENNVYFAAPAQGWFTWGTAWGRHQTYDSIEAFRGALGIDTGSRILELTFADPLALDFRLAPGTMAEVKASYPQGPIPGVSLGALPATR
jgi:Right handed beta helix region